MNYKNLLNFLLVEGANSLKESLNLNGETTPSILGSLSIHVGAMFVSQEWRILSTSMLDSKHDDITQRFIMSPKDMLESYVVLDICLFREKSQWQTILNYDEDTNIINESSNHVILGIAEGNSLVSENLRCDDTLILHGNQRILWHIK